MNTIPYNQFIRKATDYAWANNSPMNGCFELTPLCNLDCKMCYIHLNDPSVRKRMLSGDEWIALIDQAIDHGMLLAMLTGGEAMTHPDFRRIYLHLIERGISVRLKSNGILLNQEMIELFTQYPPYNIDVSLYGCDGESYRAVTGHDVFETVQTNIRAAISAGLHLRLIITPSAYMLPWVDQIMEYAKNFGANDTIVNAILMEANPDTGRKMEDYGLSLEEIARIYRKSLVLFSTAPKSQAEEESELMGERPEEASHASERGLPCSAGRTSFAINWDGTMEPCLEFPRDVICTDVRQIGFAAAWQTISQAVRDYALPEECRACSYNDQCHYCPVQHKRLAAQHRCVPEMCAWRKKHIDILEEYRGTQPSA